jgi:hypothetical protein
MAGPCGWTVQLWSELTVKTTTKATEHTELGIFVPV